MNRLRYIFSLILVAILSGLLAAGITLRQAQFSKEKAVKRAVEIERKKNNQEIEKLKAQLKSAEAEIERLKRGRVARESAYQAVEDFFRNLQGKKFEAAYKLLAKETEAVAFSRFSKKKIVAAPSFNEFVKKIKELTPTFETISIFEAGESEPWLKIFKVTLKNFQSFQVTVFKNVHGAWKISYDFKSS
jgi:cell division protein FtsB